MKVSIITVAYNSGSCMARTIESVLAQTAGGIEYVIIDGASKDHTVEVAESYRAAMEKRRIEYHIFSEPDNGIYDAMNKGIRLATGDVIGFLNSGDWYEADMVKTVQRTFAKTGCEIMFANIRLHGKNGRKRIKRARLRTYQTSMDWNHPTMFVRAGLYRTYPFGARGIHDDYGFYLRMRRQNRRIVAVDKVLANFCMGGVSNRKDWTSFWRRIRDRYLYCYRINGYSRWYLLECIFIEMLKLTFR